MSKIVIGVDYVCYNQEVTKLFHLQNRTVHVLGFHCLPHFQPTSLS
jgi:hypothetical protein